MDVNLSELDHRTRAFITELANPESSFDEVTVAIAASERSIQSHISTELRAHRDDTSRIAYREALLDSLYFPDIDTRQEQIHDAHRSTFEWIFDETGEQVKPWVILYIGYKMVRTYTGLVVKQDQASRLS